MGTTEAAEEVAGKGDQVSDMVKVTDENLQLLCMGRWVGQDGMNGVAPGNALVGREGEQQAASVDGPA
jgi:hypothetical protein